MRGTYITGLPSIFIHQTRICLSSGRPITHIDPV
jgi:hypothetical protein